MSKITPVYIDLESFWSTEHTLSKMSPTEYVMHPLTEIQSISIGVGDGAIGVLFGEKEIRAMLAKIDWSNTMAIGHNMSGFDALILRWRFGINPKMWGCTAAMARSAHSKTQVMLGGKPLVGVSLKKLAAEFGVGAKLDFEATNTKGKRLEDFTREEMQSMREYNRVDTELCRKLFKKLIKGFPKQELLLIDMTTRMLVDPQFELDMPMLEVALSMERDAKHKALLALAKDLRVPAHDASEFDVAPGGDLNWHDEEAVAEFVRAEMASAARFGALLQRLGVPIPMKQSKTDPDKDIPALAKTDEEFIKLQEHPDPVVAAAVRTRLQVKSTLLETRLEAFMRAGKCVGGMLPIPLKYAGADTTGRWSGEQYNCMTEGHELLTPNGWVPIESWHPKTPVMQWWPSGHTDWCTSPGKVEHEMDGVVAHLDGPFVRGVFTLDHRVPARRGTGIRDYTAGWIADRRGLDGVPAAGVFVGGDSALTENQVRMLVATAADGCEAAQGLRWGFTKQRKIDRLVSLASSLDLPIRTYDYRDRGGHWVATLAEGRRPAWLQKGLGPWILSLSRGSLDAFVDELKYWDGMAHHKSGQTCFFTSKLSEAEWVSTAIHLSGAPARIGRRSGGRYDVHQRLHNSTSTAGFIAPFRGKVYCPQVDSSYVLVRYANAIHVTGNCQNLPRVNPKSPKPSDALRNSLRAPKGMKVIVSDLSGIELRVNMFLWKVQYAMDLFKADPEKADLYKYFAANSLFRVPESEITKDQRQVGKVSHLGLGFSAGAATFQKVAKLMGGIDMPLYPTEGMGISASETVDAYRSGHPEIVKGWKSFQASLPNIMQGIESSIDPWGMCVTEKHAVRLPSGRRIHYPGLRREVDANGKSEWWYGHGRTRARIYAGKGVENCIAEGTPVLCGRGWVPIEQVTTEDLVHDGVEFVQHAGTVFKSVQPCITLDGVCMTPDHEVLTDDGWTQASQVQRPFRPDLRHVDCAQPRTVHGQDVTAGAAHQDTSTRKPVYDVVNCGPRHRFVIQGASGPMVVHNCVQALARDVIAEHAVKFYQATGLTPALTVHDELVYVVPEGEAEDLLGQLQGIMRAGVSWWPELVTWSEGDIADTYGAAK